MASFEINIAKEFINELRSLLNEAGAPKRWAGELPVNSKSAPLKWKSSDTNKMSPNRELNYTISAMSDKLKDEDLY